MSTFTKIQSRVMSRNHLYSEYKAGARIYDSEENELTWLDVKPWRFDFTRVTTLATGSVLNRRYKIILTHPEK